jgi:ferredoxin
MPIKLHLPLPRHLNTMYIELNTSKCQACWKCVESCPNHVLGKAILFHHRHAHVDQAKACKGCKKCVRNCPNNAIRYTYVPPIHKALVTSYIAQLFRNQPGWSCGTQLHSIRVDALIGLKRESIWKSNTRCRHQSPFLHAGLRNSLPQSNAPANLPAPSPTFPPPLHAASRRARPWSPPRGNP